MGAENVNENMHDDKNKLKCPTLRLYPYIYVNLVLCARPKCHEHQASLTLSSSSMILAVSDTDFCASSSSFESPLLFCKLKIQNIYYNENRTVIPNIALKTCRFSLDPSGLLVYKRVDAINFWVQSDANASHTHNLRMGMCQHWGVR